MIRGKQSKEAVVSDGLVAGGVVRVRRNGADLITQLTSPADGSCLGTRGLLAGEYVAADEAGGEHSFTVAAEGDLAVIPIAGASNAVTIVGLHGDVVDRIAERKAPAPRAKADVTVAKKPAAKKKTAAKK